jgi:hypothetical protein
LKLNVDFRMDLIARARQFATEAHQRIDQRRKYSGQPYQEHLKAVAALVAEVTDDAQTIAAAWLHDTVEDTPATFGDLEREFGPAVARLVSELTDVSRPGDGNRAVRKAMDRNHTAQASPRAKTVKLADLTDNCRDICRHDPGFARVYLAEAAALLEVLHEGDQTLYRRAQKAIGDCARHLGLPRPPQARTTEDEAAPASRLGAAERRMLRMFTQGFAARDLAEPLRSFDSERPAAEVAAIFERQALRVAGVRQCGLTVGWTRDDLAGAATLGERLRPFARGQVVQGDARLSELVVILTHYDFCFVTAMGDVAGVVTRDDLHKPVGRMWLFGIITLIELDLSARLTATWPDGGWTRHLSPGRFEKAETLLQERRRRGHQVELIDCLQLADKAQILTQDETQRAHFGFPTKGAARRVIKDIESLRNHLAHAQDIVTHDWPQIARLARWIEDEALLAR